MGIFGLRANNANQPTRDFTQVTNAVARQLRAERYYTLSMRGYPYGPLGHSPFLRGMTSPCWRGFCGAK